MNIWFHGSQTSCASITWKATSKALIAGPTPGVFPVSRSEVEPENLHFGQVPSYMLPLLLVKRLHFKNHWLRRTVTSIGGEQEMKIFGINPVFLHSLALPVVASWSFLCTCLLLSVPLRWESLDYGPQTLACTYTHLCRPVVF